MEEDFFHFFQKEHHFQSGFNLPAAFLLSQGESGEHENTGLSKTFLSNDETNVQNAASS